MRSRERGFTLIELMVVMTLAAILLGVAIPSFRDFVAGQRVKNTAFDFAAALLLARSEAVKRNTPVTLEATSENWQNGWTVNAGATTLSTQQAPAGVSITATPADTSLSYQATGRVGTGVSFQFEAADTSTVRCVTIGVSGVPNTTSKSCS